MEGYVLPLGKDPPAITSLSFNHNGKILAATATDGMIHVFDTSAGLQITGWPAHDPAISSILFGPDETSIFSLGVDGKVLEWSLQNQGQILWSRNCSRFCDPESSKNCRHEMALDANGRRLLGTSGLVRAPIYQAGLALGELRKENNFLRSLWPVTNPPSSQEHLLHPQLLQKPLRPFLARGYFDDVGV